MERPSRGMRCPNMVARSLRLEAFPWRWEASITKATGTTTPIRWWLMLTRCLNMCTSVWSGNGPRGSSCRKGCEESLNRYFSDPQRTTTAILPGSTWSVLLSSIVVQDAMTLSSHSNPSLRIGGGVVEVNIHVGRARGGKTVCNL